MNRASNAPTSVALSHSTQPQTTRSNRQQRPAIDTSVRGTYARVQTLEATRQSSPRQRQAPSSSLINRKEKTAEIDLPLSSAQSLNILGEHLQSHVLALHDFTPIAPNATCLSFQAGQVIQVLNRDPSGWWDGELEGRRGWFPSNYVTGLDQIGKLKEEVFIELRKPNESSQPRPSVEIPDTRDTDQILAEQEPGYISSSFGENSAPSSPTIVRKTSLPIRRVQPPHVAEEGRSESPPFSLYQAIASGCVSTRSISPSLSMSSAHQPLLTPLLHAVSLLNRAVSGRRQAHYQPSTACVISCVRSLLMSTECLHRDAPVLKRIPALARERKVILGNLATLVAQARRCSEWPSIEDDEQNDWQESVRQAEVEQQDWELEQMIRMGGEVLRNVTRFLELCEETGVELPISRHAYPASGSGSSGSEGDMQQRIRTDLGVAAQTSTPHRRVASGSTATPISKAPQLTTLRTKSLNDLRARRRMQHLERSKQLPLEERASAAGLSLSSMSSLSTSSATSAAAASFPSGPCSPAQVLAALRSSNDALLSSIAAFIGHVHSYGRTAHATSKGHLIEVARETVDMVRQLLTIVESVARHPDVMVRGQNLQLAKTTLFDTTNALVEAVRAMTSSSPQSSRSEEEERWRTLQGATAVLKVAGDCVAAVKVCLSRPIGNTFFVVCLPSLSSKAASRVSYLRRRSISVSGCSTVTSVHKIQESVTEEDLTIQAVDVSGAAEIKEHKSPQESSFAGGTSNNIADSEDDEMASDRSRRSSIAETTPATSVIPEEKELALPFEEKILHGELPLLPPPSPGPTTPPDSAIPPSPSSQTPSPTPVDLEAIFALSHDYDIRDIAYNSDGAVVGATLSVMIERMTPHDALVDPAFQQIFMMTWRLFISPSDLVSALVARYNRPPPVGLSEGDVDIWSKRKATPVKLRVANLIKSWLESFWRPQTDDVSLTQLSHFVRGTIAQQFPAPAQRILDIIRARTIADDSILSPLPVERTMDRLREIPTMPPTPLSPSEIPRPTITKALFSALKSKNYSTVTVTDFDVLELARQFTIMESKLYLEVRADEVLELGQTNAPAVNVKAISTLSTAITGWVTECILNESDAKKRTNLVKFFIKVADRCSGLSNFSTSRSILAALDSSTISRLHQTWAAISQKHKSQLEALRKIADHARNYSEYRSRLRNTNPPAVPFMGLYLTDITFCREGNPNYRASPRDPARQLINFNKYHKLARIVQDMQRFQVPYNLKHIPEVQQYLTVQFDQAKNAGDLQDLYRRSLLVEPRRPADSSLTPADGKPMLQIWGLGTLTRNQGLSIPKPSAS